MLCIVNPRLIGLMPFHHGVKANFPISLPTFNMSIGKSLSRYKYFIYRDNRPFGFLYRKISNLHISWAMNIIVVYILVKFFKGLGWNLATFGLFGLGESKVTKKYIKEESFYKNPALVPFAWNFIINQTLIIVYANIEINSRVASTNPVYYWAFA